MDKIDEKDLDIIVPDYNQDRSIVHWPVDYCDKIISVLQKYIAQYGLICSRSGFYEDNEINYMISMGITKMRTIGNQEGFLRGCNQVDEQYREERKFNFIPYLIFWIISLYIAYEIGKGSFPYF